MSDRLQVPWGDGVSAIDRTTRSIVLLTAQALDSLNEKGWRRDRHTAIEVDPDGLPVWVTLRGKRVFELNFVIDEGEIAQHGLAVSGRWLVRVGKRAWPVRLWWWLVDRIWKKKDAGAS